MCLFHRVLGLPRPKRAQALNTRANAGAADAPDEGARPDDAADARVYAAAAAKFADDLERHGADGACVAAARERGRNARRRYENDEDPRERHEALARTRP